MQENKKFFRWYSDPQKGNELLEENLVEKTLDFFFFFCKKQASSS